MNNRRVVITGIGVISPLGNSKDITWESMKSGVSGADYITKFDASKFRTRFACEIRDLDINKYIHRKDARRLDPVAQYSLVTSDMAIEDSGLDLDSIDLDRSGVIYGSGIGGLKTFQDETASFAKGDGTPRYNPFFIPKMIVDIIAGHISMRYGFRGINFATVSACATSTNSLAIAYDYIKFGKNDIIISGGAEASVVEAAIGGFNASRALSERNDDPKTASRPFDRDRDGFVLGEGAVTMVLEELEHAKKRGAKIYAEIVGAGYTADAHHITAPHPEGLGAKKVMKMALKDANMNPEDIDYVNVHGTSTPLGDVSELIAMKDVFGDAAYKINISSTKSMTGHLLGATGAIEIFASIMAINDGIVPPTINHFNLDERIDPKLNLTFNKAQERKIRAALSNTFGFGGHNFSLIVKKFED